jgi:hypothetical protein
MPKKRQQKCCFAKLREMFSSKLCQPSHILWTRWNQRCTCHIIYSLLIIKSLLSSLMHTILIITYLWFLRQLWFTYKGNMYLLLTMKLDLNTLKVTSLYYKFGYATVLHFRLSVFFVIIELIYFAII